MWLLVDVCYLLVWLVIAYFLYTVDPEMAKQLAILFAVWAVLGLAYLVPFFLRTYMTIRDGQLAICHCGVLTVKYEKDRIVRVRVNGKKLVIGLRGDKRISLLDSPEARRIFERLQIPIR